MSRNRFEYKEYLGTVEWYDDKNMFKGKVLGIRSNIAYEGKNIDELRKNFYKSIDNYIEVCEKNNVKRDIPYKGAFNIRISPELYRLALERCEKEGVSISKLVNNALDKYLGIKI